MDSNVIGNANGTTGAGNGFYALFSSGNSIAANAIGNGAFNVSPIACTLSNFYVNIDTSDPTSLQTYAVYQNGVQTSLAVALAAGNTTGNNTLTTLSVAAGDQIQLVHNALAVTLNQGTVRWTLKSTANANQSAIMGTTSSTVSTTVTSYISPMGVQVDNTAAANAGGLMPTSGTIKNAYVKLANGPGAGKQFVFTLVQNGVATSLAMTVTGAGVTTGNDTNPAHAFSVSPGDLLVWQSVPTGSPTNGNVALSAEFDPTINGESVIMMGTNAASSTTAVRYQIPTGVAGASVSTEQPSQTLTQAAVLKKFYVQLGVAPGSGKSWRFQVSVASFTLNPDVTIANTATTGNDTTNLNNPTVGNGLAVKITPSGTPAALTTGVYWGFVSFIAPPVKANPSLAMTGFGV